MENFIFIISILLNFFCSKRISLVGDSITQFSKFTFTQEKYLKQLVSSDNTILTFGHEGRSARSNLTQSQDKTLEQSQALNSKPDIVIIMLGTNDNQEFNKDQYIQDQTKLINKFLDLPTQPYVYIMTQIPIQRDFLENNPKKTIYIPKEFTRQFNKKIKIYDFFNKGMNIVNKLYPNLAPKIAKSLGLSSKNIIRLDNIIGNEEFRYKFYCSKLICDGIHPTKYGARKIAEKVMKKLNKYNNVNQKY